MADDEIAVWYPLIRAESGSDIYTKRLVEGLNARGIKAEVSWLPHRAEYAPWTVTIPEPPSWANIVHINNWLHPRFIPKNVPLISTLHSCAHDPCISKYKSSLKKLYHNFWLKWIENQNLKAAKSVVAVSNYTADVVSNIFGRNDIVTVYNGVRLSVFFPEERKPPCGVFTVLYAGNFLKTKGVDLLEPIFNELGDGYLLICTSGRNDNHERFKLPLNSKVVDRINTPEEMARLYRKCDALIFPTRMEGFGLVAAEAMACGLPVVASDNTSLPEVVQHGKTGFLCPTDDVKSFVNAIRNLAENSDVWDSMRSNAIEHVANKFREEDQIDRYINIYRSILDN